MEARWTSLPIEKNKEILMRHIAGLTDSSILGSLKADRDSRDSIIQQIGEFFNKILNEILDPTSKRLRLLSKPAFAFNYSYFLLTSCENRVSDPFQSVPVLEFHSNQLNSLHQLLYVLKHILQSLQRSYLITKREIYYSNVDLFGQEQANLDSVILLIQNQLRVPRSCLNIIASSKGLVAGKIQYQINGQDDCVDLGKNELTAEVRSIQPSQTIDWIDCRNTEFILLVEKETVFQRLVNENNRQLLDRSCIVTAKGYGDYKTKEFVKKMSLNNPSTPLFYFGDCDAFGIDILMNYTFGSENSAFQFDNLPNIHYLGTFVHEFQVDDSYSTSVSMPRQSRLSRNPHSKEDKAKFDSILSRYDGIRKENNDGDLIKAYQLKRWCGWLDNVRALKDHGYKYEVEDLYASFEEYPRKDLSSFVLERIFSGLYL